MTEPKPDRFQLAVEKIMAGHQAAGRSCSFYKAMIVKATGCALTDAEQVEDYMRMTYRVLDGLDRRTFNREAKLCWQAVQLDKTAPQPEVK